MPWDAKSLALKYKGLTHCTLKEALEWVKLNYHTSWKMAHTRTAKIRLIQEKDKYLVKELQFKGFIRQEDFKDYNPKLFYVRTNRKIDGSIWFYPQPGGHDSDTITKYPDIYQLHNEHHITGCTTVGISYKL